MGNFSTLADLPDMYRHCKTTEDKDMGLLDFFTDHLLDIDGVFDHHDNGDEQKPHSPQQFHHSLAQTIFFLPHRFASLSIPYTIRVKQTIQEEKFKPSGHFSPPFRPPIV